MLTNFVFTGLDILCGKPGLLHLEDLASQRVLGLLGHEFFGQFPVSAFCNLREHLFTGGLSLAEFDLSFQAFLEGFPEFFLTADSQSREEFLVELGLV